MYDSVNNIGSRDASTEVHSQHINLIKDIKFGAKNIKLNVVILFLGIYFGKSVITKSGQTVCTCRIADSSGSIDLSLWDELSKLLKPGDVIFINNAYATGFKGHLSLNVSRGANIEKHNELCFLFEEFPYLSETPLDNINTINSSNNTPLNHNSTNKHPTPTNNISLNELNNDPRKINNSFSAVSTKPANYKSTMTSNNPNTKFRNISLPHHVHAGISNTGIDTNASLRTPTNSKSYGNASTNSNLPVSSATNFVPKHSSTYTENKFTPRDPRLKNS